MDTDIRLPDSKLSDAVDATLQAWDAQGVSGRIWQKDYTLWSKDPTELSDRLGWLELPEESLHHVESIQSFAAEIRDAGIRHIVLLGMGGSSLAPEVFGKTFGSASGYPSLIVLDSTHPEAVGAVERRIAREQTLFLVSSKSGTTLETLSLYRSFWERVSQVSLSPGQHFVAITDPGSALETLAGERGFRRIFLAPPSVGGRYSSLSVFGLVPAGLVGAEVGELLQSARSMAQASSGVTPASRNPSLRLGVTLGTLATEGIDKLTFLCSPALASFPAWIEQLVAESLGKDGKGIVPVDGEIVAGPESYSRDRIFVGLSLAGDGDREVRTHLDRLAEAGHPVVSMTLERTIDLGAEMYRWELATAAAGVVLGIHPFNQPDVQLAKRLAKEAMASKDTAGDDASGLALDSDDETGLKSGIDKWAVSNPGDYLCIQAYLHASTEHVAKLQDIRTTLGSRLGVASTLGFGPRFLHSTGQLHKGGANNGLFLQLVDEPASDIAVPETDFTFGELIAAQALGDYRALSQRGRRILRVNLGKDAKAGLESVREAVS